MKPIFVTALICALSSVVALLALSAMTVVPQARDEQTQLMLAVAVLFVGWCLVAAWARRALGASAPPTTIPVWLRRGVVGVGVCYVLFVLLFTVG